MSFSNDYRSPASASGWNDQASLDAGLRSYMLRVYNWMASGLLLTGIVAYVIANTGLSDLFFQIYLTAAGPLPRPTLLGDLAMLSPLAFVLVMSFGINRLSLQGGAGAVLGVLYGYGCQFGQRVRYLYRDLHCPRVSGNGVHVWRDLPVGLRDQG